MSVVRSTKALFRQANPGKLERVAAFVDEYRKALQQIIDHAWDRGLAVGDKTLDVAHGLLWTPAFIPKECLPDMETLLSGRALKCASTQAMSMIKAALKRRQKDLRWLEKLKGAPVPRPLKERLSRPLVKPCAALAKPELNSICASVEWTDGPCFDGWLSLHSLGKEFGRIEIPLKRNRHLNKLMAGDRLPSVLLAKDGVDIRFEMPVPEKHSCACVGADTGMKTVLTLSDGQATPDADAHGHSLPSICAKVARKRKGSKACARAHAHRLNFINWSINRLDLSGIGEIRLEKVRNINHGKRASGLMRAWTNADIQRKVEAVAEERNVSVKLQPSAYRSQRCSACGCVRKANRKGKLYTCKRCGFVGDADLNAARNHEQSLPYIPDALFRTRRNLGDGFLWLPTGFFDVSGAELAVPPSQIKANDDI